MSDPRPLLRLDARRRISLGALAGHDYYLAEVAGDGVITLTPAVVIPLTASAVPAVAPRRPEPG